MSDSVHELEKTMKDFVNRYRAKKIANMICSITIIFMGVFSVIYIYNFDNDGILTFRWMTVEYCKNRYVFYAYMHSNSYNPFIY